MKKHLVVLGGGIKGAATAAVASLFGDFQITLIERNRIGSGTTSTNHGRLHLGTAGWRKEAPELIQRRRKASELVRRLPGALTTSREALYCFEDEQDAENFTATIRANGMQYKTIPAGDAQSAGWIDPVAYPQIIEVPEHSFSPARLAGRFAQTCVNTGGKVMTDRRATRVDRQGDRFVIALADGDNIDADIVVNTASRWCNTLALPPEAPRPDIKWFRWRLLCLRREALLNFDRLERVLVVMDRQRQMPSAIPHDHWITLDYNTVPVEEVPSPEGDDESDWREFNSSYDVDQGIFAAVARTFRPLMGLLPEQRRGKLFSLAGIHARRSDSATGSQNRVESVEAFEHYFIAFGGQASTGLLDAIDICNHLYSRYSMAAVDHLEVAKRFETELAPDPIEGYQPMRWEQHR